MWTFSYQEMLIRTLDPKATVQAASETSLPIWVGYSLQRSNGSLYLGLGGKHAHEDIGKALGAAASMGVSAFFIMHTRVENIQAGFHKLRQHTSLHIGAYGHSMKLPPVESDTGTMVVRPSTANQYLGEAQDWVNVGAQVIDGCCGITPAHISALSTGLSPRRP